MNEVDFLLWVRGPGLAIASVIFVLGMTVKMFEIFMLGRKKNLAELRGSGIKEGFRTIITRSGHVDTYSTRNTRFTHIAGWVFHIGCSQQSSCWRRISKYSNRLSVLPGRLCQRP